MKVIIICIVLFALTYNVNGAPADNVENTEDNDLLQLLKDLKTHSADDKEQDNDDESETAKHDNNDDDNELEALFASLMKKNLMNEEDNAEWSKLRRFRKFWRKYYRSIRHVFWGIFRYSGKK